MSEKKVIKKENWVSNFTLVGKPKISDGYTFEIDKKSKNSQWIYNKLNIGIDCGEKFGTVYAEMMGGYSENGSSVIYANGKKEDGSFDKDKKLVINWDDRFNDEILEQVSDLSLITVGLEKTDKGHTFYKKFLSAYDAIAYIKEHLTNDMVVNVRGNLSYSIYKGDVQVKKRITNIALSKAEDSSKYKATFTQSILLDKDSASFKNIDKNKGIMYVNSKVIDYVPEINGVEIKMQYPLDKQFEFELDLENKEQCKKNYEDYLKVKEDVTQVNFEGELIEKGAAKPITWDDIKKDVQHLVDSGFYTKEELLATYAATNKSNEKRMVLKRPLFKLAGEERPIPIMQKFEKRYKEEDLVFDFIYNDNNKTDDDNLPFDIEEENDANESMDWLNDL